MAAFSFDIRRKRLVYLVFTVVRRLWRYALSSSNYMKWIIKTEPTSRWSLYTIFGKREHCTETEWCWIFTSNRSVQGKLCCTVQIRNLASTKWKSILVCWHLLLKRSIILLERLYLITLSLTWIPLVQFRHFVISHDSCFKHAQLADLW